MDGPIDLSDDVREAIHGNRKVEAIKQLRAQTGLGLKEAKDAVESYAAAHPHLVEQQRPAAGSGMNLLIVLSLVGGLAYLAYRMFA